MSTYPNFYPRPLTATTIEGETSMTETQEDVLVTGDITLAASNSALQISGTVITTVANMILATVPTDADWHVLQGLEDVEANSCFRIAMRAPFLALNFNNVSDPTGKVFISDGYIS